MDETDLQLIAQYARENSQDAFAEIVRRHIGLVHSAALRQVRSPELAEEVAQSVFTDLARQARHLPDHTILTAWLYEVTRRSAIDVVRREASRRLREEIATEMNAMNAGAADWTNVEPLLDEAMQALDDVDRTAVLLRYFENKSLREVGQSLGTSDDTAQKRVSRAVERLRQFFAKRGVSIGAGGLVAVISANAIQAVPVGLSTSIGVAALAGATITTTAIATATKTIVMTTFQKALVSMALTAAIGTAIYEGGRASALRKEVNELQGQQAALNEQLQQLTADRDKTTRQLAGTATADENLNRSMEELLKLRGEVARLRGAAVTAKENDLTKSEAQAWLGRVQQLRTYLNEHPEKRIPEIQFVSERDWLSVTASDFEKDAKGVTEAGYRHGLSLLYDMAKMRFSQKAIPALKSYEVTHENHFPTDVAQLKPHFTEPMDDAVLQRYAIMPTATFQGVRLTGEWVLAEITSPDQDTMRYVMSGDGSDRAFFKESRSPKELAAQKQAEIQPLIDTLLPVAKAYAEAHGDAPPATPEELRPYATTGEQQSALQKLIRIRAEAVPAGK
jgi:RNA polymerase sigma factor (sigma-70 family)